MALSLQPLLKTAGIFALIPIALSKADAMKKPIPIQLFLFFTATFLTLNSFGQRLPDPGTDPLATVDSVSQNPKVNIAAPKEKGTMIAPVSQPSTKQVQNQRENFHDYSKENGKRIPEETVIAAY